MGQVPPWRAEKKVCLHFHKCSVTYSSLLKLYLLYLLFLCIRVYSDFTYHLLCVVLWWKRYHHNKISGLTFLDAFYLINAIKLLLCPTHVFTWPASLSYHSKRRCPSDSAWSIFAVRTPCGSITATGFR